MFSTKLRTLIIALVASSGFAAAAVAPAVSQAQWHNYCVAGHCVEHKNFTEGGKSLCEGVKTNYNNAYDGLLSAMEPTNLYIGGPSVTQTEQERAAQIAEEEARVREAERAAFESGCELGSVSGSAAAQTTSTSTVAAPTAPTTTLLR
jgi:hypothetical protein